MPAVTPITIFDYIQAISEATGSDRSAERDEPLSRCEICQVALTLSSAYPARFGIVRCRQCIGDDGFATVLELEEFHATGTIGCPGCGTPVLPAAASPDGASCRYQCSACGATARFSIRNPA